MLVNVALIETELAAMMKVAMLAQICGCKIHIQLHLSWLQRRNVSHRTWKRGCFDQAMACRNTHNGHDHQDPLNQKAAGIVGHVLKTESESVLLDSRILELRSQGPPLDRQAYHLNLAPLDQQAYHLNL